MNQMSHIDQEDTEELKVAEKQCNWAKELLTNGAFSQQEHELQRRIDVGSY